MKDNVERRILEAPVEEVEDWIVERVATHRNTGLENEWHLSDGAWLRAVDFRMLGHSVTRALIDITELKHHQEELDAALKHVTGFVATISYEIRTPLNGLLGMATLMCDAYAQGDK